MLARRTTLLVSVLALVGALAAPGAWADAGTVLSAQGQAAQVIVGSHVHKYGYSAGRSLAVGDQISFAVRSGRLRSVKFSRARARKLSFTATVVRDSASGLVLRLPDRGLLKFAARKVERACAGKPAHLSSGQRLRVTELRSAGGYRLSFRASSVCSSVTAAGTAGAGAAPSPGAVERANGTVSRVNGDGIVVTEPDGNSLSLKAPADALNFLSNFPEIGLAPCETVAVSYQATSSGLDLDSLAITGQSLLGCVEQDGISLLSVGTLESIGADSFTLATSGQGTLTIGQGDPSDPATDGFNVGELVLVAYSVGSDGGLVAADMGDDVLYTTGTVVSVAPNVIGVKDATTGAMEQFLSDQASYSSVRSGDTVGIAYTETAAGLEGENVDDLSNATSG